MDNNDKRRSRLRDLMNQNKDNQEPDKPKPIMGRKKVTPDFKNKDLEVVNILKEVKAMSDNIRRPSNLEDIPRYAKETLDVLTRQLVKYNLPADDYKSVTNQFTAELLNTINNHLKSITDRKEDVNSLRQTFKELQEKNNGLLASNEEIIARGKQLQADVNLLSNRKVELEAANSKLSTANVQVTKDLENLQAQYKVVEADAMKLLERHGNLEKGITKLTEEQSNLQTNVDYLKEEVNTLGNTKIQLIAEVNSLNNQVTTKTNELQQLNVGINNKTQELASLTVQMEERQAELEPLNAEVEKLTIEIKRQEITISNLEIKAKDKGTEVYNLNMQINECKDNLDKANKELELVKVELEDKQNTLETTNNDLSTAELNLNKVKNEQATYDLINRLPQLFVDTMKTNSEDIKLHVTESLEKVKGEGVSEVKEHITSNTSKVDIGSSLEPIQQGIEELKGEVIASAITEKSMRMQSMQNEALLDEISKKDSQLISKDNRINELGATVSVLMEVNKIKDALAFKPEILKKSYLILMNSVDIPSNISEPIYNQSAGYAEMLDRSARLVMDNPYKWNKIAEYFANVNSADNQLLYIPTPETISVFNNESVKDTLIKYRALKEEIVTGNIRKYIIDQDKLRDLDSLEIPDEDKLNLSQSSKQINGNLLKENLNSSFAPIIDNIVRRVTEGHEVAYLTYNIFALAETPLSELSDTANYVNPIHKDIITENLPILKSLLPNIRGYRNPRDLMGELESVLPYVNENWVIEKFVSYLNDNFKKANYKYNLTGVGDDFKAPLKRQDTNILIASQGDFAEVIKDNIVFMLDNSRASLNKVDGSTNPMSEVVYLVPALISIKEGTIHE